MDDGELARLYQLGDLVTPMALRVAATLRIADCIDAGHVTAPALAAATGAHQQTLDRLLRHLVTAGVLDRDEGGRYSLTPRGELLRDGASRTRERWDIDGALGRADLAMVQLLHAVRTGGSAFAAQYGRSFWDDLALNPERVASFDATMGADVASWAPAIIAAYDWGSLGHVIDVGGGDGTLMISLLSAHPELRGTVFDLPATAEAARTNVAAAGLSGRADIVAGSFFGPLPSGAAGYVLTAILHDWPDEEATAVLRRCGEAAGEHGKVFVIEKIGSDGHTPNTEMDLRLLVYFGGRERTRDELVTLIEAAGCSVDHVHPAGSIAILETTCVRGGA